MHCTNCGTQLEPGAAFCPNCGTSVALGGAPPETPPPAGPAYASSSSWQPPAWTASAAPGVAAAYHLVLETRGRRVLAYLIDIIPMLVLSLLHLIPIFGWMLYGLLHVGYWLLRDINGASPGKHVLRSVVLSENGAPSTTNQRLMRNVPLALPGLIGLIPLIGLPFELGAAILIVLGEAILLLATGSRFGDRLARTNVFRAPVIP